jgi:hypothetical protein
MGQNGHPSLRQIHFVNASTANRNAATGRVDVSLKPLRVNCRLYIGPCLNRDCPDPMAGLSQHVPTSPSRLWMIEAERLHQTHLQDVTSMLS